MPKKSSYNPPRPKNRSSVPTAPSKTPPGGARINPPQPMVWHDGICGPDDDKSYSDITGKHK